MRILHLDNGYLTKSFLISALLGKAEYEQLRGVIEKLCVFSPAALDHAATIVKTGARHNSAKYLLFPASLRAQLPIANYDIDKLTCGTVIHGNDLFVIYKARRLL